MNLSIEQLIDLVDLPKRTIRFYIQKGLVDRPVGERKAAYYTQTHVEQLLSVKRWKEAGLNLDRIAELANEDAPVPELIQRAARIGDTSVVKRMFIAEGVTLELDAEKAQLTSEQNRTLITTIEALFAQFSEESHEGRK